jgi:hypothetical protein
MENKLCAIIAIKAMFELEVGLIDWESMLPPRERELRDELGRSSRS